MIIGDPILTLTDPASMVVTVQEAKDYLNIDYPTYDDQIQGWIMAGTDLLQQVTGLLFLPSTVKVILGQRPIEDEDNYICIPFYNNAVLTTSGFELVGNRIYTNEPRITVEYTAGKTEQWMKDGVLKYVADCFIHRGEEGVKPGAEAIRFVSPYISHGGWF